MATSKHIDRICVIAVVIALLISVLFMNGAALGIQAQVASLGYEDRLFDTGKVHTVDIVIDDWDGFLETAESEEYTVCNVVIDGEAFRNVGIRGKGNTSLSNVSRMDSSRYSFKIEFDQYDSSQSYYGLDKLSLNNLIQDNTMMKDYLVYRMMGEFGVAAPLCSYVYITVNGEDWGLYLAVEGVEEAFLQRNYGSDYGELYKPDNMNMGGGRGNGKDFDMSEFSDQAADGEMTFENMPSPEDMMGGTGFDPSSIEDMMANGAMEMPDMGIFGMGFGETTLQYTDDDPDSYSVIFSSAKTDVTNADQARLIAALKDLSEGNANAVDVEAVIRYFVVHNYVVNGDSYTGSMVHNYYLYEKDGQLSMIPWDYNLAFGTFQGGSASNAVNDDIDAPLSVTGSGRPMIDWIFGSEEYTRLYHQYFREFLNTVDAQAIIAETKELIAPYVEKDPTKFCTYEEFETGVDTLAAFCDLRSRSVTRQLAGEEANVDASAITLSDMGSMGSMMGSQGGMEMPAQGEMPQMPGQSDAEDSAGGNPQFPGFGGQGGMEPPEGMEMPGGGEIPEGMEMPGQSGRGEGSFPVSGQTGVPASQGSGQWLLLAVTVVVLAAGLVFAIKFKR